MSPTTSLGHGRAGAMDFESAAARAAGAERLARASPEGVGFSGQDMTIGEMSRIYGVSLRTLRFYEDRGLIHPRRDGSARFYSGAERVRLEMVLKGKRLGFTLTEIHALIGSQADSETPDLEATLQPQQIVNQISHLERQRREIDSAIERLRATHQRFAERAGAA